MTVDPEREGQPEGEGELSHLEPDHQGAPDQPGPPDHSGAREQSEPGHRQLVDSLTVSLTPYVAERAAERVRSAAGSLGLLGVVLPPDNAADPVDLVVAAAGRDAIRAVVDGRLSTLPVDHVVGELRMRSVASVVVIDPFAASSGDAVVAQSIMPAAMERAKADAKNIEAPFVVAATAPVVRHEVSRAGLSLAFGADVVDAVVDGRQLVSGRPPAGMAWASVDRPIVGFTHTPTRTVAMLWTRKGLRVLQSPLTRFTAMYTPDVVFEWHPEFPRLADPAAPADAIDVEDALVASLRLGVSAEERAELEPVLTELGAGQHLEAFFDLVTEERNDQTLDRVVAAFDLPPVTAKLLRGEVEPMDVPGAQGSQFQGIRGLMREVRDDVRRAQAEEDTGARRRRLWFAAVLPSLAAIATAIVAFGPWTMGGGEQQLWFLVPTATFGALAVWRIVVLVSELRTGPAVEPDDPADSRE